MLYFSMDCEGLQTKKVKGPATLPFAEKSIIDYTEILEEHDILAEFFITPEAAKNHTQLFKSLSKKHKLSLHLHLASYQNCRYFGQGIELANLTKPKQKEVLKVAVEEFEDMLDLKPIGFRAGMGSANLYTIEILTELGINHGSLSIPNQKSTKYNVDWSQWPTVPHEIATPSGNFRNLPLTGNLKLEKLNKSTLLNEIVDTFKKLQYVAVYTHNWVDFSEETEAYKLLNELIIKIKQLT